MQLKSKPPLKRALMLATCSLLGTPTLKASQNILKDWDMSTAVMNYTETNRITATEGLIIGNKTYDDGELLNVKLVFDTLSGASANGAVAQPTAQTFTTSSGRISTPTKNHDIPLDGSFKDNRGQVALQWTQPLIEDITVSTGGYASAESDYFSGGGNINFAFDFNQKNTTLSLGFASSHDQVSPHGGIHQPFTFHIDGSNDTNNDNLDIIHNDTKKTNDILLGLTQIINRRMLLQMNYSYSKSNGYLTDPYKILSEIDGGGVTQRFLYENRPRNRIKKSYFIQSKYDFGHSILDASYRFMKDDWQIKSNTIDLKYHINLSHRYSIEPHIRLYQQSAASFYQPFLNQGVELPTYASADYRLGKMNALTLGLEYGIKLKHKKSLSFRLEYYQQSVKNPGFLIPGILENEPVFEGINALIVQVNYSF